MKSVLISIQPKWVEKICSGEKIIEVRKTRPKIETPFKCYIYCTQTKTIGDIILCKSEENAKLFGFNTVKGINKGFAEKEDIKLKGKVIGEFVCDEITALYNVATTSWNLLYGNVHENAKNIVRKACLTEKEIHDYAKGKYCCAWHISDLKIYDKPKELFDFANYNKYQVCKERNCFSDNCWICPNNAIVVRPPQSWCYVESLGE